jgi:putative DNA primase/helicase
VHAWSKWIVYSDGRWVIDHGDTLVTETAKNVARRLFKLAVTLSYREREAVWQWAKKCETAGTITALLRLARGMPGVLTDHADLDADPWLLNVSNGTIDLRTGLLRPHNPDDLLTMQAPVLFDASATAPLWNACLERWQPDPEMRAFLQRAAGTGITGHPLEALILNVGTGGNGKTKYYSTIAHVLGPYCVTPHKSLLVAQRHEQHPTHVASLFRARMLIAPETKQDDRLDEESIKNLTGGDQLRARRMREDEWSFWPTHTAVMHTNHRPRIRGTDEGIWRRVKLVLWTVTIPEHERDEHLADKLAAEASGILNYLVAGALDWQRQGLAEPDGVRLATAAYRDEQDHVGRFLADACTIGHHLSVPASTLREAYERWCADEGEKPWTAKALGGALTSRGFDSTEVGHRNTRTWIGLDVLGSMPLNDVQ